MIIVYIIDEEYGFIRITYRYKYRYYPQAPELNERSKRVCFLTHPICGCVLGCWLGMLSTILFPDSVNIPMTLMCIGMVSGPVLMHLLRKKILPGTMRNICSY